MSWVREDYQSADFFILGWLNGHTYKDRQLLIIAMPQSPSLENYNDENLPPFTEIVLTKRRVWALAPYVGDPFVYMWYVATDPAGYQIAHGESWIEYLP